RRLMLQALMIVSATEMLSSPTPSMDHKYPTSTGPRSKSLRAKTGKSVVKALVAKVYKEAVIVKKMMMGRPFKTYRTPSTISSHVEAMGERDLTLRTAGAKRIGTKHAAEIT